MREDYEHMLIKESYDAIGKEEFKRKACKNIEELDVGREEKSLKYHNMTKGNKII